MSVRRPPCRSADTLLPDPREGLGPHGLKDEGRGVEGRLGANRGPGRGWHCRRCDSAPDCSRLKACQCLDWQEGAGPFGRVAISLIRQESPPLVITSLPSYSRARTETGGDPDR
jgi:hypothetical protein